MGGSSGHSLLAVQMVALLEMDINLGELFARPVLKDFAQVVMDAQLAQVDPDEMARLLQLLGDSTGP